jgi:hypothetical protein
MAGAARSALRGDPMSYGRFDESRTETGDRDFIRIERPRPHTAVIVMN